MKKILTIALAMMLILALAACSAGGSATSSASTTAAPESAAPESAAQAGVDPTNTASQTAATAPASAAAAAAENSQTHAAAGDEVFDAASAVSIELNGDSIQAGGVIQLGARGGEQVQLWVKDSGAGIDADDLPYVFDRFYRADKTRGGSSGKMGLGLAICKALVMAQGGTITAQSAGKGQGATMVIDFHALKSQS